MICSIISYWSLFEAVMWSLRESSIPKVDRNIIEQCTRMSLTCCNTYYVNITLLPNVFPGTYLSSTCWALEICLSSRDFLTMVTMVFVFFLFGFSSLVSLAFSSVFGTAIRLMTGIFYILSTLWLDKNMQHWRFSVADINALKTDVNRLFCVSLFWNWIERLRFVNKTTVYNLYLPLTSVFISALSFPKSFCIANL